MALDNRDFGGQDVALGAAQSEGGERAWWWTPGATKMAPVECVAPTRFDVITASFQFPCALVDARAQALVENARRDGERHSLSLWRTALRDALEQISREAAHTPAGATCAALFFDRVVEEYRVAVTFEAPQRVAGGQARH